MVFKNHVKVCTDIYIYYLYISAPSFCIIIAVNFECHSVLVGDEKVSLTVVQQIVNSPIATLSAAYN